MRLGLASQTVSQIKLGKSDSGKRKMTVAENANRVARQ